ncbi:MAG: 5'/3'-nucleotidase SurE, partial [Hyphomicrobiaceae bacterium]
MRILVTNDDGIDAPGLEALEEIARSLSDDVWIVAPETNHSGAGHSLSLRDPIRMREIDERRYAVQGTPTDCVIMAVRRVMFDNLPDLILSGVNMGQNLAEDVTYSGTIAAAFEGTLVGIKSIALSQSVGFREGRAPEWDTSTKHAPELIRKLLKVDWPNGVLMNVNFPDCAPDDVLGVRITSQGRRDQSMLAIDERYDSWGRPYYWLGFGRKLSNPPEDVDLWAIYNGYISVTPLSMNLTARSMFSPLEAVLGD